MHGAFVPLGVKPAFPTPLLLALRGHCLPPARGTLTLGGNGRVTLDALPAHRDVLADTWEPGASTP